MTEFTDLDVHWYSCRCPCGAKNWIRYSIGDGTDPEAEKAKCWSCQQLHWLPGTYGYASTVANGDPDEMDVAICEVEGKEHPV